MFTRKDYLRNNCTYEQYYSQFVTDEILKLVAAKIEIKRLVWAYSVGKEMNVIPVKSWDSIACMFTRLPEWEAMGYDSSKAFDISILKMAAVQLIKEHLNKMEV